jgi:hypothetical protein
LCLAILASPRLKPSAQTLGSKRREIETKDSIEIEFVPSTMVGGVNDKIRILGPITLTEFSSSKSTRRVQSP